MLSIINSSGAPSSPVRARISEQTRQNTAPMGETFIARLVRSVSRRCVFSPVLEKTRNSIERMFNWLKNFCRIASCYDCNATNFHVAVYLAAAIGD
ncbi:transposase [Gluconacetobacter diazotrophicus]|uniref:Transposase n=1 Tax=Gluconacetobacter diazotrophicus TaxID=33996 RepID=A0A7W4I8U8_GLUDI|nr:transposase [Gluconacetobacter diazotrophicus]